MSFEGGASFRNSVTTDLFTKHEDEAWRSERHMFWYREDQQWQILQEVF